MSDVVNDTSLVARIRSNILLITATLVAVGVNIAQGIGSDIWSHRRTGQLILASGLPTQEPFAFQAAVQQPHNVNALYDIAVATLGPLGWLVVASVCTALALAVAVRGVAADGVVASDLSRGIAVVLLSIAMAPMVGTESVAVTVLGLALLLNRLDWLRAGGWRALVVAGAGFCLWSNLDPGVIVGLGALLLAQLAPRQTAQQRMALLRTLGVAVVGALVTPAFVEIVPFIGGTVSASLAPGATALWSSPDFHTTSMRVLELTALATVIGWTLAAERAPQTAILVVGLAFAATLYAQGATVVYLVLAAPHLAAYTASAWRRYSGRLAPAAGLRFTFSEPPLLTAILAICAVVAAVALAVPELHSLASGKSERTSEPEAAVTWYMAHDGGDEVFSVLQYDDYLVWRLPPRSVWFYSEPAYFGRTVLANYDDIQSVNDPYAQRLAALGVTHAIVPVNSTEIASFRKLGWHVDCYDGDAAAVVMSLPPGVVAYEHNTDPSLAPAC